MPESALSRREIVRRAIRFETPPRIPLWFVNCDQLEGDVLRYELALNKEGTEDNEWGYHLESMNDGTMGHPISACIPSWHSFTTFVPPRLDADRRLARLPQFLKEAEDRYRLASLTLSGFTVYTLLRGFENSMMDFVLEPDQFAILMDMILEFEKEQIGLVADAGFDGIHFVDDWGTQDSLMISPQLWRTLFKPRYKDQFEYAHQRGLDIWYHCCGDFGSIISDFHDIGVDVLNIAQPNVVDLKEVGAALRGQQCFLMPISYQTVSVSGTVQEIHEEAQRMYELLGTELGGFIGYVEEYGCMGMSPENYKACSNAFRSLK
ncbi:MAG: uroporphyrinogen decarboxylase family protein [Thermoguttaceae bacterium]